MKKLMIAVAIVCAAAISQAATISWGLSSPTGPDGEKATAGWVTYLVDSSKYAAFTALEGAAVAKFFDTTGNYLEQGSVTSGRGGAVSANFAEQGSYGIGDTGSAFMVLFDATSATAAENFAYTAIGSTTIAADGSDGSVNFGTFADAMKATGSSAGWQSTAGSVPEPTSGLLLLIGMAGLALRRRRA